MAPNHCAAVSETHVAIERRDPEGLEQDVVERLRRMLAAVADSR